MKDLFGATCGPQEALNLLYWLQKARWFFSDLAALSSALVRHIGVTNMVYPGLRSEGLPDKVPWPL